MIELDDMKTYICIARAQHSKVIPLFLVFKMF